MLGSNLQNRTQMISDAIKLISIEAGDVLATSNLYESSALGLEAQPPFINQAIVISTQLLPKQLLNTCQEIEKTIGRIKTEKWGPRIIDIDILYFDDCIVNDIDLKIPHPYLPDRRFSLVPLAEISPNWVHPTLNKNTLQMLSDCLDRGEVNLFF